MTYYSLGFNFLIIITIFPACYSHVTHSNNTCTIQPVSKRLVKSCISFVNVLFVLQYIRCNAFRSIICWTKTEFLWFCLCTPSQWISNETINTCLKLYFSFYSRGLDLKPFLYSLPFSKLIGQTNLILNTSIVVNIWMKILCINDCVKSRTHRHHHMLCFLNSDALPGIYCSLLQLLLVCGSFSSQFCI